MIMLHTYKKESHQTSQRNVFTNWVYIQECSIRCLVIISVQRRPVQRKKNKIHSTHDRTIRNNYTSRCSAYLLWSLHISTTYLSCPLNILKNTEVYSSKLLEAKTRSPNGPTPPLAAAPIWLQTNCGSFHSAFSL